MSEPSGEYVEAHYVWMEIGSGLGGSVVALAANHDPARVIGVDIQKQQIERAALPDDGPSGDFFRDRQSLVW